MGHFKGLFFCIWVNAVCALFESLLFIQTMSREEMRAQVQDPDFLTLVFLYDPEGANSVKVAPIIDIVAEKYQTLFKFIALDCLEDGIACNSEVREHLPALTAYIPTGLAPYSAKPIVKTKDYKGEISIRELSDFLLANMPFLGSVLDIPLAKRFFSDKELYKALLFTDKDTVPPWYKAFASFYRGRIDFAVIWHNETELVKRYEVSSFPTVLVIAEEKITEYKGEVRFKDLAKFLEPFAATGKHDPRLFKISNNDYLSSSQFSSPPKLPEFNAVQANESNFYDILEEQKKLALVQFRKESGFKEWRELVESLKGTVFLIDLNCDQESAFAASLGVTKFPSLRLFPANRKRRSVELSLNSDIEAEISKELKANFESVNDHTINVFVSRLATENNIGCFFLSETQASLPFKALSSDVYFQANLQFAYYNKKDAAILKNLNARKFPTLICFLAVDAKGRLQVAEFDGELDSYPQMHHFLEELVIPELGKERILVPDEDLEDVEEWSQKSFSSQCVKKGGICVIAFFDGLQVRTIQELPQNEKPAIALKKVKAEIIKKGLPFRFGWVDGSCDWKLRSLFNVSEALLPNLVIYVPTKQKAANLIGAFSYTDIKKFLEKAFGGKVQTYPVPVPEIAMRECEDSEKEEAEEEDEEIKEIVKEIVENDQHRKEERKDEVGTGKKKGKKHRRKVDL